jgi:hypothetical protein
VVLYLSILYGVARALRISLPSVGWVLAVGMALCWYPFQVHRALGQISLLLAACLLGGWALMRRQRYDGAGLLFAPAFLVKLFPGLIFLYLPARRQWQALATAVTGALAGWIIVVLWVGLSDTVSYFQKIAPDASEGYRRYPINISIISLPARFFDDNSWIEPILVSSRLASILTVLLGLTTLLILSWQLWRLPRTQQGEDVAFGLVCLAMPLLSPIS